jgi:hypothetical protein
MELEFEFEPGFWNNFSGHPSILIQAARNSEIALYSEEKKKQKSLKKIMMKKIPEKPQKISSEEYIDFLGEIAFGKFKSKAGLEVIYFNSLTDGDEELSLLFNPRLHKAFFDLYYQKLATNLARLDLNKRAFSLMGSYMNIYPTLDLKNTRAFEGLLWIQAKSKPGFFNLRDFEICLSQWESLGKKSRTMKIIKNFAL